MKVTQNHLLYGCGGKAAHTRWPCHKGFSETTEVQGKKTDFSLSSEAQFMRKKTQQKPALCLPLERHAVLAYR